MANLLSTDSKSVDVCTETLNELHCKDDGRVVHAILHVVSQLHIILLHQYKLIADEQINGLNVVPVVLTTPYQTPATTKQLPSSYQHTNTRSFKTHFLTDKTTG